MNFQGDDVGQVLRLLARQAKINMVVSPQVVGTINMRLEDVTALQAIEVICQAQGYDLTQTNGVYYVKTPAEKAAEPTQSDFTRFSYARAATVLPLLTSQMKAKGVAPQVDERTNTVFYQEAKSNLNDHPRISRPRGQAHPAGDDRGAARRSDLQPDAELRHQLGRRVRQQRLAEDVQVRRFHHRWPTPGASLTRFNPVTGRHDQLGRPPSVRRLRR